MHCRASCRDQFLHIVIKFGPVYEDIAEDLLPIFRAKYDADQLAQVDKIDQRGERLAALHRSLVILLGLAHQVRRGSLEPVGPKSLLELAADIVPQLCFEALEDGKGIP